MEQHPEGRTGLVAGVAAYVIWGFFPLLFALLKPAGPVEILGQRIVWSLVAVWVVLAILRRPWGWLRRSLAADRLPRMVAAAGLIGINWLTFIFAIDTGHVVESSLGYFINPLLNIVLGMLLFGERLSPGGLIGCLLALVGVIVIAKDAWQGLWISLVLAVSFGLYGVVKKRALLPALEGLFLESALLAPLALPYLISLQVTGAAQFATSASASGLLILAGVLTALPLWLFAIAAPRLPLGVVGVLQYLGPTIQFILGITVFGQHVTPGYWAGLILVWLGSAAYLSSVFARARRLR